MLQFRIELTGVDETEIRYRQAPRVVRREQLRAMEESLLDAEREVVKRTPTNKRRTGGRLRNAIMAASAKTIVAVGALVRGILAAANVPYVLWVEEDTRPHIIRARNGRSLAFRPEAGFQLRYRNTSTGRLLTARQVRAGEAARPGVIAQRGRVLYYRATAGPRARRLTTTNRSAARVVLVSQVHHPGTRGQHMFRDGARAAAPAIARRWEAARRRIARYLGG